MNPKYKLFNWPSHGVLLHLTLTFLAPTHDAPPYDGSTQALVLYFQFFFPFSSQGLVHCPQSDQPVIYPSTASVINKNMFQIKSGVFFQTFKTRHFFINKNELYYIAFLSNDFICKICIVLLNYVVCDLLLMWEVY